MPADVQGPASEPDTLKFRVAAHIVEDLGLNLYTSLPRVLVEFVANAYDADSPHASINFDLKAINAARRDVRAEFDRDVKSPAPGAAPAALDSRTLPDALTIVVEDAGHGMSRTELGTKFLIAGRRRRVEEPAAKSLSDGLHRPLMGRKGLGKLAGFGVAKRVEVVTRRAGDSHATRILLDYDELAAKRADEEVPVKDYTLADGGGLPAKGTRITLSRLMYGPLKSREQTIESEIAEHFELIDPQDFVIQVNGRPAVPEPRTHEYAWPNPERPPPELVEIERQREDGVPYTIRYRLRFTAREHALRAARRGVRVYAQRRLAALPSLLNADTNMHGFRMTDYLDGVVHADFVDQERTDYTATDRQNLRWDTPLLSDLYTFLSEEIKRACAACQRTRDTAVKKAVKVDAFTVQEIASRSFSKRDTRLAFKVAIVLEGAFPKGLKDDGYRSALPSFLQAIGQGRVLAAIAALAKQGSPGLAEVAAAITDLTRDELDQFMVTVRGRLAAIGALEKAVEDTNFSAPDNEKVVQKMFERSPWLVDPTYAQFLTADQTQGSVYKALAKELRIGQFAPPLAQQKPNERPDLVFLIGNPALHRLVIVELKSTNTPLEVDHLKQLEGYMGDAEEWLADNKHPGVSVVGQLVGTRASPKSKAKGVRDLRHRERKIGAGTDWKVRSYREVLGDTEAAHQHLLDVQREFDAKSDAEGDD